MSVKYFYPGPSYVSEQILAEQAKQVIPHRGGKFRDLYKSIKEKLQRLLKIKNGRIFLLAASARGAMEMSARNLVKNRALTVSNGAFADKWHGITVANNKQSELLTSGWGKAVSYEQISGELETGEFDCLNIVHNETSTGFNTSLELISQIRQNYPNITLSMDTVSSLAAYPIYPEKLGIDFLFAGCQKGLAVPPGITIVYCSDNAIKKAGTITNRGAYFDILEYVKSDDKNETPQTPPVTLMYALNKQLENILDEGIETRFSRHKLMAEITLDWTEKNGLKLFPDQSHASYTVSCIENSKGIDIEKLIKDLDREGITISNGYGELKNKTFRIGHMGDITPPDLEGLLTRITQLIR